MHHLTETQRYTIFCLIQQKMSVVFVAKTIGINKSTVYRGGRNENQNTKEYNPEKAQAKYKKRMKEKRKSVRLNDEMKRLICSKLMLEWSPEQIRGWCELNRIDMVSIELIYQYIWQDKYEGGSLHLHPRRKCRLHRKRASKNLYRRIIPNRRDIEESPSIVDQRTRFGDLEGDTVIGSHGSGVAVTLCDRATGMLWHRIVPSATADEVSNAVITMLYPVRELLHTITFDNGREFCHHELIAKVLGVDIYFAKPYHSWERGSNENLNGLIRQYYPKGSSFSWISYTVSDTVQNPLNNRHRKRLKILSPIQNLILYLQIRIT